jgi:hypothetical protein
MTGPSLITELTVDVVFLNHRRGSSRSSSSPRNTATPAVLVETVDEYGDPAMDRTGSKITEAALPGREINKLVHRVAEPPDQKVTLDVAAIDGPGGGWRSWLSE